MTNWKRVTKLIPFPPSAESQEDMGMFPYAVNPSFVQRYRNPVVAQKQSDDNLWYHLVNDCGLGTKTLEKINFDVPGVAQQLHYLIPHECGYDGAKS